MDQISQVAECPKEEPVVGWRARPAKGIETKGHGKKGYGDPDRKYDAVVDDGMRRGEFSLLPLPYFGAAGVKRSGQLRVFGRAQLGSDMCSRHQNREQNEDKPELRGAQPGRRIHGAVPP